MYIILETQTYTNGTVGTLIDSYENRNAAESKYHNVLAAAAISQLPLHCAFMLTDEGYTIKSEVYRHEQEVESEEPIEE